MTILQVVSITGSKHSIAKNNSQDFQNSLNGKVVYANDEAFDDARAIWNRSIDKHPAMIVQCADVSGVVKAVNFSNLHSLLTAVRGGGHNVAGNATCDGGMVIDLGAMNSVQVDEDKQTVRAGGGSTIRDIDQASLPLNLAVPLGIVSETGIGGLTLCGGHNWLTRKHGFACDNLISVEIFTADGQVLIASQTNNADLFWAVRGGGGNFGIVTRFEYRAHPITPNMVFCGAFYHTKDAHKIITGWRDYVQNAPDEFTSQAAFWSIPCHDNFPVELHGQEVVIVSGVYCGEQAAGLEYIQPLRELAEPVLDISGPIPYDGIQQAFDPYFNGKQERYNFWKSLYMDELTDQEVEQIIIRGQSRPNPWSIVPIRQMGGFAARVNGAESALGARDANFMLSIDTSWTDAKDSEMAINWTRDFWNEMSVSTKGAVYLNFVSEDEDSEKMLRASYGDEHFERLVQTKAKYDSDNMFRLNQNIPAKLKS